MTRWQLFWRNVWLTIRLSPSDAAARKLLWRLLGFVLYIVAYTAFLLRGYRETGPGGVLLDLAILAPALVIFWMMRRRHARDDREAGLGLMSYSKPSAPDLSAHQMLLSQELLRIACLVDRATGEQAILLHLLRPEQVTASRQRTLAVARQPELWDGFSKAEQQLLLDAEGCWPPHAAQRYVPFAEVVRVLRWVLRLDEVLVPFEFATLDIGPALALTARPALADGHECLSPWDLRPAQTVSEAMLTRTVAEAGVRGIVSIQDAGESENLARVARLFREGDENDLLVGLKTVTEADGERIRSVLLLAHTRLDALTRTIDYLNGPADAPFSARPLPE